MVVVPAHKYGWGDYLGVGFLVFACSFIAIALAFMVVTLLLMAPIPFLLVSVTFGICVGVAKVLLDKGILNDW